MAAANVILSDPRGRNLAILAAVALLLAIAAVLALNGQQAAVEPRYAQHEFFPNLARHAREIMRLRIQSKAHGAFDVVFKPEKGWVLPTRSDFRASFNQVQHTVVGLAALETFEPKTANPQWYSYIGVQAPDRGGSGVRITAYDEKGHVLADLIAGKTVDIGDPNGSQGLFARKPGEKQSWLLQSWFEPRSDIADWMDKDVLSIDRSRIREIDVQPASGASFTVRRDNPAQSDFALVNVPKGREVSYPAAADGVAAAISDFSFDDVQPAAKFNFSGAAHLITRTFDGLDITADVINLNGAYWAQFAAEAAKPAAENEAREINARTNGWAYKLPAYKGQQFMTTLDSLLKPLAPAASKK